MTLLFNMEIAETCFEVYGSNHFILEDFNSPYESFIKHTDKACSGPGGIKIYLEPGLPSIGIMIPIFDSGDSWAMYDDGDRFIIANHSPSFDKPLWIMKVDRGFSDATLYVGEAFLEARRGRQVLRSNPVSYPLDQILLMYILSRRDGALIHAAGIDINGKGLIFPGTSGAGKSTLSRQFLNKHAQPLSDDRIVVRKLDKGFRAYGTPWPGEGGIAVNRSVSLSKIFFLNHAADNRIKEINSKKALERLLPVTSIPWYDRGTMPEMLHFCEDLVSNVPVYELYFTPGVEVVNVLERFISS